MCNGCQPILLRHEEQRAGEGGLRSLLSHEVIGTPMGGIYGHYNPPGPLDGQPSREWKVVFHYSDGTSRTVVGQGMRSVPALA